MYELESTIPRFPINNEPRDSAIPIKRHFSVSRDEREIVDPCALAEGLPRSSMCPTKSRSRGPYDDAATVVMRKGTLHASSSCGEYRVVLRYIVERAARLVSLYASVSCTGEAGKIRVGLLVGLVSAIASRPICL